MGVSLERRWAGKLRRLAHSESGTSTVSPEWPCASAATVCLPRSTPSFLLVILRSSHTLTPFPLSCLSPEIPFAMVSHPLSPRNPSHLSPPLLHCFFLPTGLPSPFTVLCSLPYMPHLLPRHGCSVLVSRRLGSQAFSPLRHPSHLPTALLSQPAGAVSPPVYCLL